MRSSPSKLLAALFSRRKEEARVLVVLLLLVVSCFLLEGCQAISNATRCKVCDRTGECQSCWGDGEVGIIFTDKCGPCSGTGKCRNCGGTGHAID